MKNYREVEKIFRSFPSDQLNKTYKSQHYIKGRGECSLKFLNLSVPRVKSIVKEQLKLTHLAYGRRWELWSDVWENSLYFEPMLASCHYAYDHFSQKTKIRSTDQDFQQLINFTKRLDNWAHSDELSKIYALLFERFPKLMLPIIERWSASELDWERRQSVVALLYYSRFRKNWPEFSILLKFITAQMNSSHYYVQKGVGWAMRESYNIYPKQTLDFLMSVAKEISPHAWQAASEKLTANEKRKLKALRQS